MGRLNAMTIQIFMAVLKVVWEIVLVIALVPGIVGYLETVMGV